LINSISGRPVQNDEMQATPWARPILGNETYIRYDAMTEHDASRQRRAVRSCFQQLVKYRPKASLKGGGRTAFQPSSGLGFPTNRKTVRSRRGHTILIGNRPKILREARNSCERTQDSVDYATPRKTGRRSPTFSVITISSPRKAVGSGIRREHPIRPCSEYPPERLRLWRDGSPARGSWHGPDRQPA